MRTSVNYQSLIGPKEMLNSKQRDYRVLYERYVNQMYSYGMALGVEEDTLHDLIHDVFLHLFEHQNEIQEGENEKYYLLRCLKNRLISVQRKKIDFEELPATDDYTFLMTVSGLEIEEEEERLEVSSLIENMMQCLTGRQREAIYLRYMQELEYDEIAVLLGLTTKGTRKLVYRALDHIREEYGQGLLILLFSKFFLF